MTRGRRYTYAPPIQDAPTAQLQELVRRSAAGDRDAWRELQAAVQPLIAAIARRHRALRAKGLAAEPDDLAEIGTASLERLARDDFHNLKRFLGRAEQGAGSFDAWLYGTVDFVIREHLRKRFGRAPKLSSRDAPRVQPSKRDLQSHAGRLDEGGPERAFLTGLGMTAKLTIAQIFEHIERNFTPEEGRALRLYYVEDRSFQELAQELGLQDAEAAQRLLRRLNARLRFKFAAPDGETRDGER